MSVELREIVPGAKQIYWRYFFTSIPIVRAIRLTDPAWRAQFGGYLRQANSLPGEPDQSSDLFVGPMLWLRCFHGAALDLHELTSEPSCHHLGNLRVVRPRKRTLHARDSNVGAVPDVQSPRFDPG